MVFESISEGLSNLSKSSSKTTKSVVKRATKATKIIRDPLKDVAKKTVKTMPFNGDIDSRVLAHDHYAIDLAIDDIKKIFSESLKTLKKKKFPTTKLSSIEVCFDLIISSLLHERSLANAEKKTHTMIKRLNNLKVISAKWIPDSFNWDWVYGKKISLTKSQWELLHDELTRVEFQVNHTFHSLSNLIKYITVSPHTSLDPKHELDTLRKLNHSYQDDLITAKFDLVTQYKKIYYLLLEFQKQVRKETTHKNSLTWTKIQNILKIKLPWHLQIVKELRSKIDETEELVNTAYKTYENNISAWLNDIANWWNLNKKSTKDASVTLAKGMTKAKRNIEANTKQLSILNKKIVALRSPYNQVTILQDLIKDEHKKHNDLIESETLATSLIFAEYISQAKDIELERVLVQEHIDRGYDKKMVHKELSLHTWLVNRIHAKQEKVLENTLARIKKMVIPSKNYSLTPISKWLKNEFTLVKWKQQKYTKTKESYKTSDILKNIALLKKWNVYLHEKKTKLTAMYESRLKKTISSFLLQDQKLLDKVLISLAEQKILVETHVKKSEIQVKENELSTTTLWSKKIAKKALEFEHILHQQEVFLDSLEHHIEHEMDYLNTLKDQISENNKDVKKLDKLVIKKMKTLQKLSKDLKKDKLTKSIL